MDEKKPQDIKEYCSWLEEEHGVCISQRSQTHYDAVTTRIRSDFENSAVWQQFGKKLTDFAAEYMLDKKYPLLTREGTPALIIKPFKSLLEKTFRKNVIANDDWPNPPKGEWVLPSNWYSKIDDIVRTRVVVKYLDGVEFLIEKIVSLCNDENIKCVASLEAKEEGYYAAHLYIGQEFEIPKVAWDTEEVAVSIELHITTQLQEVILTLLHKYYEERRSSVKKEHTQWQWNYRDDEFVANYLGHILHYVEGMIMEVRERQEGKNI